MISDNPSAFGIESPDFSEESVEAQFLSGNICGKGACSTIYRIRMGGLQVAVKRLSDSQRLNATFISAYRKEFEIGRRLKHDALPVYRDLRVDSKEVYIVMDFVDGVTVNNFLTHCEGGKYFNDEDNLKRFLSQLLDAIAYLHHSGVTHCDLKPANIMLRNSDRAVMLIDFDKAYCSTHDLTHGGTPGISDVMQGTEKPSSDKDYAALGKVLDIIMEGVGKAIPRKFRRFRKLCDQPGISETKLRKALPIRDKSMKMTTIGIAVLVNIIFVGAALFLLKNKEKESVGNRNLMVENDDQSEIADSPDSIASSRQQVSDQAGADKPHRQSTVEKSEITDFDSGMAKYIKETESATASLRSGKLTDSEIQQLASQISDLYISCFDEIKADYRKRFPDASESDVYLALTKALGSSRTFKIMETFNKELLDTVNMRLEKFDLSETKFP